jgi:hypothetical protein
MKELGVEFCKMRRELSTGGGCGYFGSFWIVFILYFSEEA